MFFEQYSHEPALRYLRRFADASKHNLAKVEELRPKARRALTTMERQLEERRFMAGDGFSIADLALYPYTAWAAESGVELREYPTLGRWVCSVESEPGHLALLKDGAAETLSFEEYFHGRAD